LRRREKKVRRWGGKQSRRKGKGLLETKQHVNNSAIKMD
jgi:hypothetical protein